MAAGTPALTARGAAGRTLEGGGAADGVTIARAARAVGLSRTTLMYYEQLGLIRPVRRPASRYRTFRPDDLRTLALIARWRAIGLPLATVRRLLAHPDQATDALREHLASLDRAAAAVRKQRRLTLAMLGAGSATGTAGLDKAGWTALFRAIGLTDAQMRAWHAQFERRDPGAHAAFLQSLGVGRAEVGRIRRWAAAPSAAAPEAGRARAARRGPESR